MKKIIISALLFAPCLAFAQSSFTLKGKIGKLDKPAKAYLLYMYKDKRQTDSVSLKNGYYLFNGKIDFPSEAAIVISHDGSPLTKLKHGRDQLELYLEAKTMQVSNVSDSVSKAHVLNSMINNEKAELTGLFRDADKTSLEVNNLFMNTPAQERVTEAFQKSFQPKRLASQQRYRDIRTNFIKEHPQSLVSLDMLKATSLDHPDNPDTILTLFKQLSVEVRNSVQGKKYAESLINAIAISIGKNAPDFALPDTAGNTIKLSSFRGKYVLVDFWASWCKPCRAENPNLVKTYAKFHPKGLEIIGVSLDREGSKLAWINAIKQDHLVWPQVSDLKFWKGEAAKLYGIQSIPSNILVDPQGKIIAKNLRGEDLNEALGKYFQ